MADTVRAAINAAARRFDFSDTARLDAELLMAHALGVTRQALLFAHLDERAPEAFGDLVARRVRQEPIAYLTGTRAFWTIELEVAPGVLIPRADSETLIEAAVAHFVDRPPARILDLGTGPGTLLFAALDQWPGASGIGIDASADALALAQRNADRLGLAGRARLRLGDWANTIDEHFDLILANPPYIATAEALPTEVSAYEPAAALFAGADGLDDYRVIAPQLPRLIAADGVAIVEIGSTQAAAVTALLESEGLSVTLRHDLAGRPRALIAT